MLKSEKNVQRKEKLAIQIGTHFDEVSEVFSAETLICTQMIHIIGGNTTNASCSKNNACLTYFVVEGQEEHTKKSVNNFYNCSINFKLIFYE